MTRKRTIPVSLILTTLNEAAAIALFLDGVRNGSVLPAEVVVCDGGSTDDTVALLRRAEQDLPLRVLEEAGASIARGRNIAIAAANYDVLAITDAGCRLDEEWLERITAPLLEDTAIDAVGGGYTLEGRRLVQRLTAAGTLPLQANAPDTFLPSSRSFAVRKDSLLRAGGYPEQLSFAGEDTALCLRMKDMGMRFATRWDALVHWELRPTMRSFLRQYYLYGVGDGEARSLTRRYAKAFVKWGIAVAIVASAVIVPWLAFVLLLLLQGHFLHLYRAFRWDRLSLLMSFGGYLFVVLKEAAMMAGYVRGRCGASRRDGK